MSKPQLSPDAVDELAHGFSAWSDRLAEVLDEGDLDERSRNEVAACCRAHKGAAADFAAAAEAMRKEGAA